MKLFAQAGEADGAILSYAKSRVCTAVVAHELFFPKYRILVSSHDTAISTPYPLTSHDTEKLLFL